VDVRAMNYAPESFKDDEGFLLLALGLDINAVDFIATHAWTPALASAAAASGVYTGYANLDSIAWTQNLAIEAVQHSFDPAQVPEAVWTSEMAVSACEMGLLKGRLWLIPDKVWSEDVAMACSYESLPLFGKELWSSSFARKLAGANWQCLTWAPMHLLQDQALREQMVHQYHGRCVEYHEAGMQGEVKRAILQQVRQLVRLGMAVKSPTLFSEEHDWRLVSKQLAIRARFEVSLLACGIYGGHPDLQTTDNGTRIVPSAVTLQEVQKSAKSQLSQWKLGGLKSCRNFPKSCIALLEAVSYCITAPDGTGRDVASLEKMVADSALFHQRLMSVIPSDLTRSQTLAATSFKFLDSSHDGRHLQVWAAEDTYGAYAIAGLSAWLRGILRLGQFPQAESIQVTAELETMHRELQELQEETSRPSSYITAEVTGDISAELQMNKTIAEASGLLAAAIPSMFPQTTGGAPHLAHLLKSMEEECAKAEALREFASEKVRIYEEQLARTCKNSDDGMLVQLVSSCA